MIDAVERCPWCGSKITHSKFVQIQDAIRKEEQRKLDTLQKAFEAERSRAKQESEKQRRKEIAEIRQILQKDRDAALAKQEAAFARERDALQKKIVEMGRRVKAGQDVGDGGEIDLHDELRGAFPEDQVSRIKGGTLLHDVRYKGKSAGKILIDSKQRAAWQHTFVSKLRQAQSESDADHAILATAAFPAGKKELFVDSGVIVVAPARVRAMIEVLRKALIAMHVAKLSDAERSDKLSRLFKFITSASFKRKLAEASDLATEALEIDVEEKRAHDNVWKKRGTVLTRIKHVLREIDTDVSAIVEARDLTPPQSGGAVIRPAAFRVKS
jgi:hypothetical protein